MSRSDNVERLRLDLRRISRVLDSESALLNEVAQLKFENDQLRHEILLAWEASAAARTECVKLRALLSRAIGSMFWPPRLIA